MLRPQKGNSGVLSNDTLLNLRALSSGIHNFKLIGEWGGAHQTDYNVCIGTFSVIF